MTAERKYTDEEVRDAIDALGCRWGVVPLPAIAAMLASLLAERHEADGLLRSALLLISSETPRGADAFDCIRTYLARRGG